MKLDKNRGAGRTSNQIINAPRSCFYICPSGSVGRVKALALSVGRDDITFIEPAGKLWMGPFTGTNKLVLVDHWVMETHPKSREILDYIGLHNFWASQSKQVA